MKKEERKEDMRQVSDMLLEVAKKTNATFLFFWDDEEKTIIRMYGKFFDCMAGLGKLTEKLLGDEDDEK